MSNVITYFIGVSFLDFVIGLQNFRSTFLLNQGANWDFSVLSTLNWTILSTFDLIALHPLKAIVTDDRWGKTTVWLKKPQVKNSCSLIAGGNDMASAVIHIRYSLRISEQDFTSLLLASQELVDSTELRTLTEAFMDIPADQLIQLKDVWNTWLRLTQREGSWVTKLRQEANSGDFGREEGINHYITSFPNITRIPPDGILIPVFLLRWKILKSLNARIPLWLVVDFNGFFGTLTFTTGYRPTYFRLSGGITMQSRKSVMTNL